MLTTIIAVQVSVLMLALVWKSRQLALWPHDPMLRAVVGVLAGETLSLSAQSASIITGNMGWRLVSTLSHAGAIYCLVVFFLFAAHSPEQAARRARWHLLPLALAVGLLTFGTVITPHGASSSDYTVTGVMIVFNTSSCYQFAAYGSILARIPNYLRQAEPRLRRGLYAVYIGLVGMLSGNVLSVVNVTAHWLHVSDHAPTVFSWVYDIGSTLAVLGICLFLVGILYPATAQHVAATRVWIRHWRLYPHLAPLWRTLNRTWPEDALDRVPSFRWWSQLDPRSVHRRYYRRVIECRDGLVRISPHLAGTSADLNNPTLAEFEAALAAYHANGAQASTAVPVAMPTQPNLDSDVQQLITLSDMLRERSSS